MPGATTCTTCIGFVKIVIVQALLLVQDSYNPMATRTPTDHLPIRVMSELTGVNPVTLRAWERRYGLIKPHRTVTGHRMYNAAHVELVRRVVALTEQGVPIGRVREALGSAAARERFDATGLTVLPGVIDSQVHFREPGLDHKEDLATGSAGAAMGGVTAFFEMPGNLPPDTSLKATGAPTSSSGSGAFVKDSYLPSVYAYAACSVKLPSNIANSWSKSEAPRSTSMSASTRFRMRSRHSVRLRRIWRTN